MTRGDRWRPTRRRVLQGVGAVGAFTVGAVGSTHLVGDSGGAWSDRAPLNIAHQGGALEAPSNTLFAFRRASALGADVLELDVHATADGELVVVHDDTLDRTTDGTGDVADLTLSQVRRLDAAVQFVPGEGAVPGRRSSAYPYRGFATGDRPIPDDFAAEHGLDSVSPADFRVPTLREVLATFPDALLNVEIKATEPRPYEAELARLLRTFDRGGDTVVASFHEEALARFHEAAPEVPLAPASNTVLRFLATSLGPAAGLPLPRFAALQVPPSRRGIRIVTRGFVRDAHANGLAVHVWTIDDAAAMRRLLSLGVDGIMTDRPTVLEAVLAEEGVQYEPAG